MSIRYVMREKWKKMFAKKKLSTLKTEPPLIAQSNRSFSCDTQPSNVCHKLPSECSKKLSIASEGNVGLSFELFWYDPKISEQLDAPETLHRIRQIGCQSTSSYKDLESCIDYIKSLDSTERALLITSGQCAVEVLERTADLVQIDAIFIFCFKQIKYEHLLEEYPRIAGIYTNASTLVEAIEETLSKHVDVLRFLNETQQRATRDLTDANTTGAFVWFRLFHDAVLQLPHDERAKQQMLDVCRRYYKNDLVQLRLIDQFERTYQSEDAPKWYSRSSFIYKLVNRAMRTEDVDQLYVFRYFIQDLCTCLARGYEKMKESGNTFTVFRGASLNLADFQTLIPGKLIATNGFLSTSRDLEVAKNFMGTSRSGTVAVLYEINCDMSRRWQTSTETDELVAFADISEYSHIRDEQEVLFSLGSTFEIEDIQPEFGMSGNCYRVSMTPSREGTIIGEQYIHNNRKQMDTTSRVLIFGELLCKIGLHKKAQKYFEQLLENPGAENIAEIYHYLGWVYQGQHDDTRALENYEQALELMPDDNAARACVLNNIAIVHVEKGSYSQALSYYYQALDMRIICPNVSEEDLADSYTNIACTYRKMGDLDSALAFYVHSFRTKEKFMSIKNDASIRDTLYKIGEIQWQLGRRDTALDCMQRSISARRQSLSNASDDLTVSLRSLGNVDHEELSNEDKNLQFQLKVLQNTEENEETDPKILATRFHAVGIAYAGISDYVQALAYHHCAIAVRHRSSLDVKQDHLDDARGWSHIGDVREAQGEMDLAFVAFQRTLSVQKRYLPPNHPDQIRTVSKITRLTQGSEKGSMLSTIENVFS